MQMRLLFLLRVFLAFSDLVLVNMCLFLGCFLSNKYGYPISIDIYIKYIIASSVIWLLSTHLFRLYHEYTVYKLKDINRGTWRSIFMHGILFQLYILVTLHTNYPIIFLICFYALVSISFLLSRSAYFVLESRLNLNLNNRKAIILAVASMGGHWVQLLRLSPLYAEHEIKFISTKKSLENSVQRHKFYAVPDANRNSKLNVIRCCLSVFWFILISRPNVIITTGAAPGLIGLFIGGTFGAKTIWIDSIANVDKLSMSGTIAAKFADRVYTQWEHLASPRITFDGNIFE